MLVFGETGVGKELVAEVLEEARGLIAIQNAYGVPDTAFGDPSACAGPLTATNA